MSSMTTGEPGTMASASRNWLWIPVRSSYVLSPMSDGLTQNLKSGPTRLWYMWQVFSRLSTTTVTRAENPAARRSGCLRRRRHLHQFDRILIGVAHENGSDFAAHAWPGGKLGGVLTGGDNGKAFVLQ